MRFERLVPDGRDAPSPRRLSNARVEEDDVTAVSSLLATGPTAVEGRTWGQVKSLYRE